ncbi:hypothetical protein ACSW8L_15940 (plasmid) [Clostridium perfringens]
MKFIKTAWSMMDKLIKLLLIFVFLLIVSAISNCISVELGGILYLTSMILLLYMFYLMVKDDVKEFIKKVKDKMDKDNLKQ